MTMRIRETLASAARLWAGLCVLALCAVAPLAQAATYAYRSAPFAYDTPSGSATSVTWNTAGASPACTGFPNGDDDWADVAFPGGFAFTFAGTSYSSVRVYSNGIVAFPPAGSGFHRDYTSVALPAPASNIAVPAGCPNTVPTNVMVVYWLDIVAGTANGTAGASVQYELLGTAPNRRFVISWVNVKLYNQTARYNFQVVLKESAAGLNGNFVYQYTTGSSDGSGASVGVQLSTADYTSFAFNQQFIDTVQGTAVQWYPSNQSIAKSAEYRFDESAWSGAAGEIKDTSGNLKSATRTSANAVNVAAGKVCRGATFTNNTSNATIDAVATPITPASQGSIDLWYKSTPKWNSVDSMLFDATTAAARPFFLVKRASGALRFVVTDSANAVLATETATAYTYAANTWHHIAVTWNIRPGTNQTVMKIILDGVLVTTNRTTSTPGTISTLSTVYIGDNRTSGVTPSSNGSPNGANGTIDEVNFYDVDISDAQAAADMNATRTNCNALDHFHIIHSGSLVNCDGATANVTVEAHDATHALISLAGLTLNLSTSTGNGTWSNVAGGAINPVTNLGGGAATYTFSNESAVTLGLSNTFIESLNINTLSGGITESSGAAATCVAADYTVGSVCDANLSFDAAGFRFVNTSGANITNQVAGTDSGNFYLQAVKTSCATPGACAGVCTALFPSGTSVSIDLASECVNPSSCQAGQAVTFTPGAGAGAAGVIATNASGAVSAGSGSYTARSLTFNAGGANPTPSVPFTLNYSDVGQIRLWARYTGAPVAVSGNSANFVVAPAKFAVVPAAGPLKAGINFSATVKAQNSANATTPNFGNESSPVGATVTFGKCQPTGAGSSNGAFTGGPAVFTNGVAALGNLNWSEVGNGDLTATLTGANYLGSGLSATGNSGTAGTVCNTGATAPKAGNVGAFIPDHFDTVLTQACGTFSYSGQPFTVQVKAMNGAASPVLTQNYNGTVSTTPNFAKAVNLSEGNAVAGGALTNTAVALTAFTNGLASTATPTFTFTSKTTGPATVKVRAVDTDGVSSLRAVAASSIEGTTVLRAGRVRLTNAYGSELLDLPVNMRAEYWSGAAWIQNTDDSCTGDTATQPTNGVVVTLTQTLAPPTCVLDTGAPGRSGAGCAVAGATAPIDKQFRKGVFMVTGPAALQKGDFNLWLKAPTAAGTVKVDVDVPPWLEFPWVSVGSTDPSARATFGVFKSPLIYRRENY